MSSSIVLLDSGGIHYIKTPLRNMMAEMEVKATIIEQLINLYTD